MADLLMPSDVRSDPAQGGGPAPLPEPPSAKLVVRLFLIPLLIVAAAIGVMLLIRGCTPSDMSLSDALRELRRSGGERTGPFIGPAAKQRYLAASVLIKRLREGLDEAERIRLSGEIIDILDNHTRADEGAVQHLLLLALGRVWQIDAGQGKLDSPDALKSRVAVMDALLKYMDDARPTDTQKAAILALTFWDGRPEPRRAIGVVLEKMSAKYRARDAGGRPAGEDRERDIDVRIAAAATLGHIATPDDAPVVEALRRAVGITEVGEIEVAFQAAASLARFNDPVATGMMLRLLDRKELDQIEIVDREADPKNPVRRKLDEREKERFLVNAMEAAARLVAPEVQQRIRDLAKDDPSSRVREAAAATLGKVNAHP